MPDPVPSVPGEPVEIVARTIADQGIQKLNGRLASWPEDRDGLEHMARTVLEAVSGAGWLYYEDDLNIAVEKAEEARAQAEALAEALRFVHAVLGSNHLTLGASHGFDACGLCAAESKTQAALRAFREYQEPDHAA